MSETGQALQECLTRLKATEREVKRLRGLVKAIAEATHRSGFLVGMEATDTGGLNFTISSSAGQEMEQMQATILGGVITGLNHHWQTKEISDLGIAPEDGAETK